MSTNFSARLKDPTLFREANYIDGQWLAAKGDQTIKIHNPATGELVGQVPALGAKETAKAIAAAKKAQPGWRALTAKERAGKLRKLFELMMENQEDLAIIMTAEQGKPLAESRGEIAYAASFIEWFAEEGKRVYGDTIPQNLSGRRIIVQKEPIGVFAAITPWNFPAAMITRKAGPGWAAGCTGVIRPASQTPFSALALAVLAERAGLPAGVCNVITGPSQAIGGELTANPDVRKLSFTPKWVRNCWRSVPRPSKKPVWNWAAMRRLSCLTMPIWTPPSPVPSRPNIATPARPAFAPTASWYRTAFTTPLPKS